MSSAEPNTGEGNAASGSIFAQGTGDPATPDPVVPAAGDTGGSPLGLAGDSTAPFSLPDFAADASEATKGVILNSKFGTLDAVVHSLTSLRSKMDGKDRIEIPSKTDAEGWAELRGKLGRPDEAAGYDFGDPPADGESAFTAQFRDIAHARGMDQDQAAGSHTDLVALQAGIDSAAQSEFLAQQAEAKTTLKGTWGTDYDQNMRDAQAAATELVGLNGEQIESLERSMGTKGMLDFFLAVKGASGSHQGAGQGGAAAGGSITPAAAAEELKGMRADKDTAARMLQPDSAERKRSIFLNQVIGGQASTDVNIHNFRPTG